MLLDRFTNFFTSLKLTVVCLALAMLLVLFGTLAQVEVGLYKAQNDFFRSFLVYWGPKGADWRVPVFPGGYLVGGVLLINLIAGHLKRFGLSSRKIGLQLAHAGLILLLVGQLLTDMLSVESALHLRVGETKSYSESPRSFELAIISHVDADTEEVVAIPGRLLTKGAKFKLANLPFTVCVNDAWRNTDISFRAPMQDKAPPLSTNGAARNFDFHRAAETSSMDEKDLPTALLEFVAPTGSLGTWVASGWSGDEAMVAAVRESYLRRAGPQIADSIAQKLSAPQSITVAGKAFTFTLRPRRVYTRFSLTLLKATHSVYASTDIPKDFRSRVRLQNPQTGENREVDIYMNSPLRYSGLTFYQYQMDAGEAVTNAGRVPSTVLQVVRNPSWLTPYLACVMVSAGLIIHFLMHLVQFLGKRKTA
jgi:hypothetical protein